MIEDHSPISAVYFVMSETNIRKKIAQPWTRFGSDEASLSPEGAFPQFNPHPRASPGRFVHRPGVAPIERCGTLGTMPARGRAGASGLAN